MKSLNWGRRQDAFIHSHRLFSVGFCIPLFRIFFEMTGIYLLIWTHWNASSLFNQFQVIWCSHIFANNSCSNSFALYQGISLLCRYYCYILSTTLQDHPSISIGKSPGLSIGAFCHLEEFLFYIWFTQKVCLGWLLNFGYSLSIESTIFFFLFSLLSGELH